MNKLFNLNSKNHIKRSSFNLSHEHKLSGKMGKLMPCLLQEVLPGDTFNIDTESMIRFAPMIAPIYHRVNSYIHYFYVPNRIIWNGWENFITGKSDLTLPTIDFGGAVYQGSIADCLGLPTKYDATPAETQPINDLPFRAFYQIWKDYYIDQNLSKIDGEKIVDLSYDDYMTYADASIWFQMNTFQRCWEKDYFTSALPWAQKGEPVVVNGQVKYKNNNYLKVDGGTPTQGPGIQVSGQYAFGDSSNQDMQIENIQGLGITIEEIRLSEKLQKYRERLARSGSRYVEMLLSFWGVKSSDARLQRAEYLGGGKTPIVVSEILNTTGTAELPQGNMAGHGITVGRSNHASRTFEEHGFIIGIMSVMPEPTYQQGLHKLWDRSINLDFYTPDFAQIGEQPIKNQEIYYKHNDPSHNAQTFGYQSAWAEYKYQPSMVHGHFKDNLDFWHAGRKFANAPTLTQEFVECNTEEIEERIFAVTDPLSENLYIQVYHNITAIRPLPFFNYPSI